MKNDWTGGQYSLFRAGLAAYLFVHFSALLPWGVELFSNAGALVPASASPLAHLFPNILSVFDGPVFVRCLLILGIAATIPLALGIYDRAAALLLWYLWACLFGRNPLIANPSLPFVGWMLLAHVIVPKAPYGSWKAKGRVDPRGGWAMPRPIFLVAWIVMALGYSYSGATKLVSPSWMDGSALSQVLANPLARPGFVRDALLQVPPILLRLATWSALALELLFAPLALVRKARPWLWLSMVGLHLGLLLMVDFADLTFGMLLLHFLTFDPGWVRPRRGPAIQTIFYDGHCGVCHGFVRFVLAEGEALGSVRFAPLQGGRFEENIPPAQRVDLPDSVVVLMDDGRVLTRSTAVIEVLSRMGGLWRSFAVAAMIVPRSIRDALYDGLARVRYRLVARKPDACPLVPADLRGRFDLR